MAEINNGTNEMTDTKTEMAFCVFCGKQIKAGVRFCPACGSEQRQAVMHPVAGGGNPPAGNAPLGQRRVESFHAAPQKKKKELPVWALIVIIVLALGLGAGGYALISALSSSNEEQASDRKRDREEDEDEDDYVSVAEDARLKTFNANFRTITSAIGQYQAAHKGEYPVGTNAEIQAALLPYLNIRSWEELDDNPPGAKYEFRESSRNGTFQLTATYTNKKGKTQVLSFPSNGQSSSEQSTTSDNSSKNDSWVGVLEEAKIKTFTANYRIILTAIAMYQAANKGDYPVGTEEDIRKALQPYLDGGFEALDNNPPGAKFEFSESTSNATFQFTATYTDWYGETHVYTFPAR